MIGTNRLLRTRLDRLEQSASATRGSMIEQIQRAALAVLSDADLAILEGFHKLGGVVGEYTPEELAAMERLAAEADLIAIKLIGRPLRTSTPPRRGERAELM